MARRTNDGSVHSTSGMASRTGSSRAAASASRRRCWRASKRQSLEHRGEGQPVAIGCRQRVDERLGDRAELRPQLMQRVGESFTAIHRLVDRDERWAERRRQERNDLDDGLGRQVAGADG